MEQRLAGKKDEIDRDIEQGFEHAHKLQQATGPTPLAKRLKDKGVIS